MLSRKNTPALLSLGVMKKQYTLAKVRSKTPKILILGVAYLQHCHMVMVKQSSRQLHRHHFNSVWYYKDGGSACQSNEQFNHRWVKRQRRSQEQHIILCDLKYGSKIKKLGITNLMHVLKKLPNWKSSVKEMRFSKAKGYSEDIGICRPDNLSKSFCNQDCNY